MFFKKQQQSRIEKEEGRWTKQARYILYTMGAPI